jgi:hypothetical protein
MGGPRWTDERLGQLRKLIDDRAPPEHIARALGSSVEALRQTSVDHLGLTITGRRAGQRGRPRSDDGDAFGADLSDQRERERAAWATDELLVRLRRFHPRPES